MRLAAFTWLDSRSGTNLNYRALADFNFGGERMPLIDYTRGIRVPRSLDAALSLRTVFTPPGLVPPYEDQEGSDGRLRYKMRGEDPMHPENVALRRTMERGLPLIWFVGVSQGLYLPRYPVYLIGEERAELQFVVALDDLQRQLPLVDEGVLDEDTRRYSARITQQRLHQPLFRARVLEAYQRRCAMCRLGHVSLLDASHIVSDRHELGKPVVPNGLALCKIHHAAFDQNLLGVSADHKIAVRRDLLAEIDGPMLRHGLQDMAGVSLTVPTARSARAQSGTT